MNKRNWEWVEDVYDKRSKPIRRQKRSERKTRKMTLRDHRRACGGK